MLIHFLNPHGGSRELLHVSVSIVTHYTRACMPDTQLNLNLTINGFFKNVLYLLFNTNRLIFNDEKPINIALVKLSIARLFKKKKLII